MPIAESSPSPRAPAVHEPLRDRDADDSARKSTQIRASVLDAARLLGLGANSTVADWLFNPVADDLPGDDDVRLYLSGSLCPRPAPHTYADVHFNVGL